MDTMKCPHCGQELQITPDLRGVHVECPHCARQFTVPGERGQPETLRPEPDQQGTLPGSQAQPAYPDSPEQTQPAAAASGGAYPAPKITAPGAVSSLVFGILAFVICGLIFGLLAIAKGKQARRLCREHPDRFSGAGMALAGSILGWTAFVLNLIFMLVTLMSRRAGAA